MVKTAGLLIALLGIPALFTLAVGIFWFLYFIAVGSIVVYPTAGHAEINGFFLILSALSLFAIVYFVAAVRLWKKAKTRSAFVAALASAQLIMVLVSWIVANSFICGVFTFRC
jgi:hypothetical protein